MEFGFERLNVWQESRQFCKFVYLLMKKFPKEEKFGLCSQIQRAAISISSNIAEGTSRISIKEKIHFIEIAWGSLMETLCQLTLSFDLGYISEDDITEARRFAENIAKMLSGLKSSFENQQPPKQ